LDGTGSICINARIVLIITLARCKAAVLSVVRGIVKAADTIKDVLAKVCSMCTCGIASLQAKGTTTHEIVPFNDLLICAVVAAPRSRVEETSERITSEVGTVGIQLTTKVVRRQIDLSLVNKTNNLDVVRSPHELDTSESTRRNHASAMTGLRAPSDFFLFSVTNGCRTTWWCPETEIINRVENSCLTQRLLVLGGRIATVVPKLSAANTIVGVSLIGQIVVVKVLRRERDKTRRRRVLSKSRGRSGSNSQKSRKSVTRHVPQRRGR